MAKSTTGMANVQSLTFPQYAVKPHPVHFMNPPSDFPHAAHLWLISLSPSNTTPSSMTLSKLPGMT